jgi:hypothetical protein
MAGGLVCVFGSRRARIEGVGPIGVLTLAFVANLRWRKELGPNEEVGYILFAIQLIV